MCFWAVACVLFVTAGIDRFIGAYTVIGIGVGVGIGIDVEGAMSIACVSTLSRHSCGQILLISASLFFVCALHAGAMLRALLRVNVLTKKLSQQMTAVEAAPPANLLRELTKASLSLREMEQLVDEGKPDNGTEPKQDLATAQSGRRSESNSGSGSGSGTAHELVQLDHVRHKCLPVIHSGVTRVVALAHKALMDGLKRFNQAQVGGALQVHFNLQRLPAAVERVTEQILQNAQVGGVRTKPILPRIQQRGRHEHCMRLNHRIVAIITETEHHGHRSTSGWLTQRFCFFDFCYFLNIFVVVVVVACVVLKDLVLSAFSAGSLAKAIGSAKAKAEAKKRKNPRHSNSSTGSGSAGKASSGSGEGKDGAGASELSDVIRATLWKRFSKVHFTGLVVIIGSRSSSSKILF